MEYDDLGMMSDPEKWPRWPYLPLKKRGSLDLGVLCASRNPEGKMLFSPNANLYSDPKTWAESSWKTPEELVEEGWVVD